MEETLTNTFLTWGIPVLILATGILIGWLFKRIIHLKLKNLTQKTQWRGDDITLKAIESQILPWIALTALYIAVKNLEVVKVDIDNGLLVVKGAVPGNKGSLLLIKSAKYES